MVELQELLGNRADLTGGNDVARKRSGGDGLAVGAEGVTVRIVDPRGYRRKVSRLNRRGGEAVERGGIPALAVRLIVAHEEQLVPAIEQLGNPHGSAQREAVLIPFEGILRGTQYRKGI